MANAFVTGGSGFVGRNLLQALVARGDKVAALVRSDAAAAVVEAAGATPVRAELHDVAAMARGMEGASVVYHAAAKVEEWGTPEEFERVTVEGTLAVLAAARAAKVSTFVHVGTEAVFVGGEPLHNVNESRPIPRRPLGLYPGSKARAEQAVVAANSPELRTVVVRPRLIWGHGDTAVLPKVAAAVKKGRFSWIDGGHYLTSTCHVRNVAEGLIAAAERGRGGEAYFLTDGPPVEFRAFMSAMLATVGAAPVTRSIPFWLAHAIARVGDALWSAVRAKNPPPMTHAIVHLIGQEVTVDDAKARRELGYQGLVSREEGLSEMQTGRVAAWTGGAVVMQPVLS